MKTVLTALIFGLVLSPAMGDELTLLVEQDLARLGYDTGDVDGEESVETIVAISKFQAQNNLEITGEVSRDLARALMVAPGPGEAADTAVATASPAVATASPASAPADISEDALMAAREACLQEKVAAAKAAEKKRGFGRLLGAVARTVTRTGNIDMAQKVGDLYSASATASDVQIIAQELGISEEDVVACQTPTP